MFLFLSATGFSGERFTVSFDNGLDADFSSGPVDRIAPSGIIRRPGKKNSGALITSIHIPEFSTLLQSCHPGFGGIKYRVDNVINPESGMISFWIKPYFNALTGKQPVMDKFNQRFNGYYYLFDSGNFHIARVPAEKHDGNYRHPEIRENGIQIVIGEKLAGPKRVLFARLTLKNGSQIYLSSPINWKSGTWHKVEVSWNKQAFIIVADGKVVSTKNNQDAMPVKIPDGYFTIGASWFGWWTANAVIDEFKIDDECISGDTHKTKK